MRTSSRLAVFALLLVPSFASAADPPEHRVTGDLVIQARDIFKRYCSECHTGADDPGTSKLKLMDHKQVVGKKTPVPLVALNGRSLILELVKDGSMPPGNKPGPTGEEIAVLEKWVSAKAPAYPLAFDDQYTLTAIADDLERERAKPKGDDPAENLRYVSFAHLVRDGQQQPNLVVAEKELNDTFSLVSLNQGRGIEPVDPAATLFRLDTSKLGWRTREVFTRLENRKEAGAFRLQPFDLLLLEYPHALELAVNDPLRKPLARLLAHTNQVRPVPFVRGDWLTGALAPQANLTPLTKDIEALSVLENSLAKKDAEPHGPPANGFAGAKPVVVPAAEGGRTPIPPLSAWYSGDVTPAKAPFDLKAELVVAEKPVTGVKVDEAFELRVSSTRDVHFVLLMVQADGEIRAQPVQGGTRLKANTPRALSPQGTGFVISGITGGGDSATEHFVLFASETELPVPTIVRSKHADKHIWRFLMEPTAKESFDPNAVVRQVIPIKVTRK